MRLGLVTWWAAAVVGVVGGARLAWQPVKRSTASQPGIPIQTVPNVISPLNMTAEVLQETESPTEATGDLDEPENKNQMNMATDVLQDTDNPTKDTGKLDEPKNKDPINMTTEVLQEVSHTKATRELDEPKNDQMNMTNEILQETNPTEATEEQDEPENKNQTNMITEIPQETSLLKTTGVLDEPEKEDQTRTTTELPTTEPTTEVLQEKESPTKATGELDKPENENHMDLSDEVLQETSPTKATGDIEEQENMDQIKTTTDLPTTKPTSEVLQEKESPTKTTGELEQPENKDQTKITTELPTTEPPTEPTTEVLQETSPTKAIEEVDEPENKDQINMTADVLRETNLTRATGELDEQKNDDQKNGAAEVLQETRPTQATWELDDPENKDQTRTTTELPTTEPTIEVLQETNSSPESVGELDVPENKDQISMAAVVLEGASETKRPTIAKGVIDEPKNKDQLIHSEELLEKYGYLDCVPSGSEANTRLHRLLLYRRRHLLPSGPDTLDGSVPVSDKHMLMKDLHQRHNSDEDEGFEKAISGTRAPTEDKSQLGASKGILSSSSRNPDKDLVKYIDSKRRTVTVWDPFSGHLHHLPICSPGDIAKAVRKFQDVYHVGSGGTLDTPTVGLLSRPRCGNPDNVMEEPEADEGWQTISPGSRYRRGAPQHSEVPGNDSKDTNIPPYHEMLHRMAAELREAANARHPKPDSHQEWEPNPHEALKRRKRWLEEMKGRYASGEEDSRLASLLSSPVVARASNSSRRGRDKRSLFSYLGRHFTANLIRWRLVTTGYSSQLDVGAQRASLALAFRMWSEVVPLIFLEHFASSTVDISIGFGKRSHLGCVTEFDGLGGELGHTLRPAQDAQIHMDDDEHFTLDSDHGTNLVKVAVHEIGHVLGLNHVAQRDSVMHAVYERVLPNQGFELGWNDRKLVQKIYGPCMGSFDTVFDLLRWRADGSLTYNTFFFRRNHFWMYENRYNRTRFGDPLKIQFEWGGLPDQLDGYAHVWTRTQDIHLAFKGEHYYVYDPRTEKVTPGYPRRIAHDFHGPPTPKRPNGRIIPNNIDTVYFDKRDGNLYFFKGKKVYGYDVSKGSEGCCLPGFPRRVHEEFPPAAEDLPRLPRALDAAYYSYTDQKLYFIKGQRYWEVATFHPHDKQRNNTVVGPFSVYKRWYDICDTELDPYDAYTMLNNFLLLTVGLLALALASPSLLPSAERGIQEECGTAVCGAVVTVLTQRLAGCRLLLVASPGNTEVLACVLRYEVRQPPDGQWGVRNESGHFTGIVGSLEREEADLSMVLIPTPDRLKVMDHSRLYGEGTFVIISLKPQPPAPTWAFVESFRGTLWLELLAVAVTWGVLLWMMLKLWASWGNENKVTWNSLTSSILYGFGALLEDPPHRPPTNISAQVMVGWWWLVCIIITAAYRSALISHLTIPGLTRPINTFDDLLALKRWTWSAEIVILNMADKDFFLDSPSPVVREVYRRMEFCTLEESLRKVLKGRHSFITWKNYIDVKIASQFTDARGITPLYISTRRYPIFGGYSWGFRKGAPFLDTIRRVKQRLLETGILTYWLEDVIKQRVRVTRKDSQKEQDVAVMEALKPTSESGQVVLGLSHLQGPFYLLFGGFVISMITFMGEKILTAIRPCRKYVTSG
ncbi:uncharacterized protein LOC126999901 isoform X2 [Eriocheir sinensis]|uniref:uncharacterized protein LOC126999901 isoform X2 n=1 Tax=Eriocheir sinensis TaxID=95602 RepID=UPI0021C6E8BD|nr:uncharacterized protein LOC126999901 isoform X2 [Eriocheir sinensis]